MPNPFLRFIVISLIVVSGLLTLRWAQTHITVLIENRLIQILDEAVTGVG